MLTYYYGWMQIDFHDAGRGPRVPAMTDYFGFTLASLNEKGSVFANPCKGEKNMSTLMYRPFSSWANNSEGSPISGQNALVYDQATLINNFLFTPGLILVTLVVYEI